MPNANTQYILRDVVTKSLATNSLLQYQEMAAPATPSAGYGYTYAKSDGKLYYKNSAGTEYDLTATGGGGGVTDGDKGDITISGTGTVYTIDNNVVTLAKMAQIATASFLGRTTAATGNVEVLTATQATAMLNTFTGALKGLVPSGGSSTTYLKGDGTWATPSGSGTVNSGTATQVAYYSATGTAVSSIAEWTWDATNKRSTILTSSGLDTGFIVKNTGTGASDTATIRLENSASYATFFISTLANGNSDETGWYTQSGNGYAWLNSAATEVMNIRQDGTVLINANTLKTAPNSTTRAGITFRSGSLMTTPTDGSMEYNGTHLYFVVGSTRYQLDQQSAGGGGISRSVNSISAPTTAGATANTDYVYFVSGTTTLTLPTAVSNTNRYTIKNSGTNTVTVATTSSQTIDGSTTITLIANQAVDVISNNANWFIV